jgi:uncharacterized lipoprotein YddW (UPF0748 family)
MRYFLLVLLLCFDNLLVHAQSTMPKREFRAAWVATVGNIDWPSQKGLSSDVQKDEFIFLLDQMKRNGLNAVIVQIRPAADAFFESPYENWTRYLSGKQGQPPSPYYDPLTFMIEECHKRCMEFHAWFNPYRALVEANKNLHVGNHVTYTHPEWFLTYGGKLYFDPGLPEVRDYFTKVVLDVVKRYDIDAVHFDDYFYPYRIAGVEFPDFKSYAKYGQATMSKDDWRRDNVNRLMESLSAKIKKEKSWVKFGISPFGVWRNYSKDPEGSMTNGGQTNYDDLYADVLLWLKRGWVDYMLPQLYWERGHRAADYVTLIKWWSQHAYGRHMYIGHGLYQVGVSSKSCWRSFDEIKAQVDLVRATTHIDGSAFYSANSFIKNKCNINYFLSKEVYPKIALLPQMKWIDSIPPAKPKLKLTKRDGQNSLQWMVDNVSNEPLQYAIYRFEVYNPKILSPDNLIAIVRGSSYEDRSMPSTPQSYVITALDRLHNESEMSNIVE